MSDEKIIAPAMLQPHYLNDHLCPDAIASHARLAPARTALVCGAARLTWGDLNDRINRLANALIARGCEKGARVCMLLPNGVPSFLLFWATTRAGCVIVPLNPMLDDAALIRLTNDSGGHVIFADAGRKAQLDGIRRDLSNIDADGYFLFGDSADGWSNADSLIEEGDPSPPDVSISPDDPMTIFYSSGTTGEPKGIEHSHFGRLNYCYGFGAGLAINRYSVAICATPIYASGTLITMLPTLYYGGTVVLIEKFSPAAFVGAVTAEGGTHSFMVPAMYAALLQHEDLKADLSSLRILVNAGQTMPLATRDALAARIPSADVYEVYGMTEGFFTLALPGDFALGKRNTVGRPGFLEDIRIIDEQGRELATGEAGEIVAYGPGMMKGYYGNPAMTAAAIWIGPCQRTYLRSGDLGHLDEDGFLYVSGRKKDMIKSGGINIYAVDIEEIVSRHPAVSEVAVVGLPHAKWTETPVGVVILRRGASVSAEELLAWTNGQLAKYQRLSAIHIRDDVPRATYGKVRKDRLREELAQAMLA
jgi:acyl-CoA synthetase (AMP-forming)/AMP-acid ligase II